MQSLSKLLLVPLLSLKPQLTAFTQWWWGYRLRIPELCFIAPAIVCSTEKINKAFWGWSTHPHTKEINETWKRLNDWLTDRMTESVSSFTFHNDDSWIKTCLTSEPLICPVKKDKHVKGGKWIVFVENQQHVPEVKRHSCSIPTFNVLFRMRTPYSDTNKILNLALLIT